MRRQGTQHGLRLAVHHTKQRAGGTAWLPRTLFPLLVAGRTGSEHSRHLILGEVELLSDRLCIDRTDIDGMDLVARNILALRVRQSLRHGLDEIGAEFCHLAHVLLLFAALIALAKAATASASCGLRSTFSFLPQAAAHRSVRRAVPVVDDPDAAAFGFGSKPHLADATGAWNLVTRLRIGREKVDPFLPFILAEQPAA